MIAAVIVPLVIAAATIATTFFAYERHKRVDLRSSHIVEKRELYRDFLQWVWIYKLRTIRTDHLGRQDAVEKYLSAQAHVLVFSPDKVRKNVEQFDPAYRMHIDAIRYKYEGKGQNIGPERYREIELDFEKQFGKLLESMREDIGSSQV